MFDPILIENLFKFTALDHSVEGHVTANSVLLYHNVGYLVRACGLQNMLMHQRSDDVIFSLLLKICVEVYRFEIYFVVRECFFWHFCKWTCGSTKNYHIVFFENFLEVLFKHVFVFNWELRSLVFLNIGLEHFLPIKIGELETSWKW